MKITKEQKVRIKSRPYYAFLYAKNVLGNRLPEELEVVLGKDPQSCYLYAKHVMKGKLPEHLKVALMLGEWDEDNKECVKKYLQEFES